MKKLTKPVLLALGFEINHKANSYTLSIEKSNFGEGECCNKIHFTLYPAKRFTYVMDGAIEFSETKDLVNYIARYTYNIGLKGGNEEK